MKKLLFIAVLLVLSSALFAHTLVRTPAMKPINKPSSYSLAEVVLHTLNTNPELRMEVHLRNAANAEVAQARAAYFPTVEVHGRYGREYVQYDHHETGQSAWRQELGVELRQMLFDGHRTANNVLRTQSKTNADAYSVFSQAEDVSLKATEAYIAVLCTMALLKVASENVATHFATYTMIQARAKHGVGRVSDVEQARSRWELAKVNFFAAQHRLYDAQTKFHQITGLYAVHLSEIRNPGVAPSTTKARLIDQAIKGHPRLQSALEDIKEGQAAHRVNCAPHYPHLDLIVSADDAHNVKGSGRHETRYGAFLELRYNIFRGGRDSARQEQSAYELQRAMEIHRNTRRQVVENMRLAWNMFIAEQKRLPALREHKHFARRAFLAYRQQFTVGKRALLDVLDIENEFFSAQVAYIKSYYQLITAKYRILNAKGCLVRYLHLPLPPEATVPF